MKKKSFTLSLCLLFIVLNSCNSVIDTPEKDNNQPEINKVNKNVLVHKFSIKGHDTYINEIEGKYYYADNITITQEQFNYLRNLSYGSHSANSKSTIMSSFIKTWPNGKVYYKMPEKGGLNDSDYNTFKNNIKKAFEMLSSKTIIKFLEHTTEAEYINFVYSLTENSSPLGWSKNQINQINVASIESPGIIAHEIMHSLGIGHEQCRPDRDEYVTIYYSNIPEDKRHNFNILPDYAGLGTFDFNSIMLYDPYSFNNYPTPTIGKGKNAWWNLFTNPFGYGQYLPNYVTQREAPSDGDIAGINHLYNPIANGDYTISSNLDNGKNIDINGNSNVDGTDAILYSAHTANNQKFLFRKSDHGYYIIKSKIDTAKVLTVRDSKTNAGTPVELRKNDNKDSQKWLLLNLGNEGFSFVPKNALDLRLEVKDGKTNDTTPIVIGTSVSDAKQRFKLKKVN
ncbi:flavastacin [Chryseobacterium sp. Tr-659]|uniref:M12 family metallopeptidase n=1 Tax=Chryseobacterium sp. Tr-659 TaxID=2608340 RepID=UPI00141E8277|nr:M12 family metallopeptidase [Chryseobacterium sp. Tr-659]NIF06699.1 flavastacin [Chryseobacterium sp. Tr-659]